MSLLIINNLHTYFTTKQGVIKAVNGVSLNIEAGKTLGIIGESGSGKSQTAMSVLKLFLKNQKIHDGEIIFDGQILSSMSETELCKIRGNSISMIFQEPMTSLNPVFTVSRQIEEVLVLHRGMKKQQAQQEVIQLLEAVKIPSPERIAKRYPHELSGGMRQRVMIAMALACRPKLLIADEPTTALDVTIQAQILMLMNELKNDYGTAIMFITHDLGVIRKMASEVAVMYCGQVVEQVPAELLFNKEHRFSHPYTEALFKSIPAFAARDSHRLISIPGSVPHPLELPTGCNFAPRCAYATDRCKAEMPQPIKVASSHYISCFFPQNTREVTTQFERIGEPIGE